MDSPQKSADFFCALTNINVLIKLNELKNQ